ncbi:MAG: fibronectin type III domain-containing protein [Candidatus Nanopelagicales bacterium]
MALTTLLASFLFTTPSAAEGVTEILLTGDSVTQGSAGDWTWRYRLWQHLVTTAVPADFVGPRTDLYDYNLGVLGSYDYVDPGFDTHHAAVWASSFTSPVYDVADLVREYHPDVVVESLGLNDLAGYLATPQTVLAEAADYVAQARAADPEVDVVLTTLPQTWIAGTVDYNAGLPTLASKLSSPASRVVVATPPEPLLQFVDTWDPAHLSATGEVKVAAGVADALAALGVGSPYPRPLLEVANGPRSRATLGVRTEGSAAAELTWIDPPGATGEYIWMRDVSVADSWKRVVGPVSDHAWHVAGLRQGHDYEFRLQAIKGTAVAEDMFSNTAGVTRPPPGIVSVRITSHRRGLRVRWWPTWKVPRGVRYRVRWWPKGHRSSVTSRKTSKSALRIRGLRAGRAYRIVVRAWKAGVPGPRKRALGVTRPR